MSNYISEHAPGAPGLECITHGIQEVPTRQLLLLWACMLRELYRRRVVRLSTNTIGDIAEELVCHHYRGERGSFTQKAWEVWEVWAGGDLLQVKAIRMTVHPWEAEPVADPQRWLHRRDHR